MEHLRPEAKYVAGPSAGDHVRHAARSGTALACTGLSMVVSIMADTGRVASGGCRGGGWLAVAVGTSK